MTSKARSRRKEVILYIEADENDKLVTGIQPDGKLNWHEIIGIIEIGRTIAKGKIKDAHEIEKQSSDSGDARKDKG